MPISKDQSLDIVNNILKEKSLDTIIKNLKPKSPKTDPLPLNIRRQTDLSIEAKKQRLKILKKNGMSLNYLEGNSKINNPDIFKNNIENFIGITQVPTGIIGPLRINGLYSKGDFYVPLSTTEGALIASYNRGAKIISLSGGATTICLHEKISRAPGFTFNNIIDASQFIVWCVNNFKEIKQIAEQTTSHGKLENINTTLTGNQVFLNLEFTTGDASGQNMITIASEAICKFIISNSPIKPKFYFVESNMSGDKKATALSFLSVRGKKVISEIIIPNEIVRKFLHTTPHMMMEYWKMSFVGGVQSGSLGVQGHYANGLAAIFLSCGQDIACVSEASIGITRIDITPENDLYVSVTLPNLIVGTVGGGTNLPTQKECLSLLGCLGTGTSKKFAEICTATVLAGEISIIGSLAANQFSMAHEKYGRQKK